ncbi:uncharacterized protein DS421_9g263490 [Arachis hypogaea]|nr:uncharacterized protein DS421_9g263490 [Arachis hypogaea]
MFLVSHFKEKKFSNHSNDLYFELVREFGGAHRTMKCCDELSGSTKPTKWDCSRGRKYKRRDAGPNIFQ